MLFALDPSSPIPLYTQIVEQVRAAVAGDGLRPEDPLPSVRQLAAELRVNPNTVVQAYRELEREGLVYVRRGQGTFVAGLAPAQRDRERARVARALVERMLAEAFRLGLSAAEVRETVDACLDGQGRAPAGAAATAG